MTGQYERNFHFKSAYINLNNTLHRSLNRLPRLYRFIILLLTVYASACNTGNSELPQQIVIKFSTPVQISSNGQLFSNKQSNAQQLDRINLLSRQHQAILSPLFSRTDGGLNQSAEFSNYITFTLSQPLPEATVEGLVIEFDQLEIVDTAYRAPVGEDAGMSRPQN